MKTQDNQKFSLIKWITSHRLLFFIIALLTFTLVVLVPLMYIIPYNQNKKVSFSDDIVVDKFVMLSKEVNADKSERLVYDDNYVKINIELYQAVINQYVDEPGYYNFKSSVTHPSTVSDLKVEVVLKYDWVDLKSDVTNFSLNTKNPNTINLKKVEHSPLWFVDIKKPNIYIKVSYTVTIGNFPEEKVGYAKASLNNLLSTMELEDLNKSS